MLDIAFTELDLTTWTCSPTGRLALEILFSFTIQTKFFFANAAICPGPVSFEKIISELEA